MHTPPGENEYISVNVSLFVIYIMYTYPINPPNCPQPSATTSACNVNRRSPPSVTFDYINCILFQFLLIFQRLQSDNTICDGAGRPEHPSIVQFPRCGFVKGYSYSYTLCREIKHPNAAVHCLEQT